MPPQDRGVGSPLGPLGPPGRAKARREGYIGTSGPAGAGLGWAALRCAAHCTVPVHYVLRLWATRQA